MKKIILAAAALILSAGMISAQDMAQATETFNNGATALGAGDKAGALEYFQKALEMGEALGVDGEQLVENCKSAIPGIVLSIAKDLIQESKYSEASTKLDEAAQVAQEYGNEDVAQEAKDLVPQMWKLKGANDVKAKDLNAAADAFAKAYAADTTDGKTALTLGQILSQTGKTDEAIEAFRHAAWNGEEANAKGQVSNLYVREANEALRANKLAEAVDLAEKANSYSESANAYLIAGQASQKLNRNPAAISNFEKYLEISPNAKNAPAITFTVAALYQGAKNNAKAIEFYKKVQDDAQFGAQAKQMIDALNK